MQAETLPAPAPTSTAVWILAEKLIAMFIPCLVLATSNAALRKRVLAVEPFG